MDFPTIVSITEDEIDLNDLLAKLTLTSTGAAAIFAGMVRGKTSRGDAHETVLAFIERYRLVGSGIGWMDAHLLCAAQASGWAIWTAIGPCSRWWRPSGDRTVTRGRTRPSRCTTM